MSLVYAGVCCHAPGITNRPEAADPAEYALLQKEFARMRAAIESSRPDALFVISAEHFANFFSNNMPAFSIGMADHYDGPIEDPAWLGIPKTRVPGNQNLSRRLIAHTLKNTDVSYAEEWKFDHGIMVPLHHLTPDYSLPVIPANINCQAPPFTPLARSYNFGQALRVAFDAVPERIALISTGGTSHWPCTPDSGKINSTWDERFLDNWAKNDVAAMIDYRDDQVVQDAGAGALEIRTSIAVAGAAGGTGTIEFYKPIPEFACGCLIATMSVE
ncbi:MAG: extradiol ring-cleavage dioxygenase [Woeseia sp.]|jgi:aromatic ring-opening dioxygenase catalytic subunit (LigB family)|nr:extradiol ring-cleavage dioxygenase [Woeseia sp.]MBT6210958.1 extradiol ring-cleavage dioxygenase [Woeseia sp.]